MKPMIPKHLHNAPAHEVIQYLSLELERTRRKSRNRAIALRQANMAISRLKHLLYNKWAGRSRTSQAA